MAVKNAATAFGMIGLGGLILWSGITNAGIVKSLQDVLHGVAPSPGTPQASFLGSTGVGNAVNSALKLGGGSGSASSVGGGGSATGNAIAQAALKYEGYRYVWGGHGEIGSDGRQVFDCYGLLTYVLHHDLGYNLPNNTHSGYLEFLAWSGASRVDRAQVSAGDLVIWPTHSGIAIDNSRMISAENPSAGVKVATFEGGGPIAPEPLIFLRVKGAMLSA